MPPRSRYTFAEHSPEWPLWFESEAESLRALFGDDLIAVHHIGSTSVPGLAAKPIIDMLPVVRQIAAVDEREGVLTGAGFRFWGEHGLPGRRFLTKDRQGVRTRNVHFYADGHPDIERHVAFRDYLRCFPEQRETYELLKREAYAKHPNDIDAYSDCKNAWIKSAEKRAIEWRRTVCGV